MPANFHTWELASLPTDGCAKGKKRIIYITIHEAGTSRGGLVDEHLPSQYMRQVTSREGQVNSNCKRVK